ETSKDAFEIMESSGTKAFQKLGTVGVKALKGIGAAVLAASSAIAGLVGAAIKVGMSFEQQMSRVQAISGATGEEFAALEKEAIDLGAGTAFSATEAAEGMENLASAGFSV